MSETSLSWVTKTLSLRAAFERQLIAEAPELSHSTVFNYLVTTINNMSQQEFLCRLSDALEELVVQKQD